MRYDLKKGSGKMRLAPGSTTSMRPVLGVGPKGADGSNVLPTDIAMRDIDGNSASAFRVQQDARLLASMARISAWARNPDQLIAGTITRDGNGAATSAPVVWPDGSPGTYTADTVSTAFPGAVDAYHITYGSPVTKTYTQPAVTRNSDGAVTAAPAIVVT